MASPDDVEAAQIEQITLTMRANVYTRITSGPGQGQYSPTPVKVGLKCHLSRVSLQAAPSSPQRADLASGGDLIWQRGYVMPNGAQLSVDTHPGWRFMVRDGTQWANTGSGGGEISRYCQVTRIAAPAGVS